MADAINGQIRWRNANSTVGQLALYLSEVLLPAIAKRRMDISQKRENLFGKNKLEQDARYKSIYLITQNRNMGAIKFIEELSRLIRRISYFYRELGKEVESLLPSGIGKEGIIGEITKVINEHNIPYACNYMDSNLERIKTELSRMENKKLADELIRRMEEIIGVYHRLKEQIRKIRSYIQSTMRWQKGIRMGDCIAFVNQLIAEVKGYKWVDTRELEGNHSIRKLRFYDLEIKYLEAKYALIEESEKKDAKWERFRFEFYKKSEEVAKHLREFFGDGEYAELIARSKKDETHYGEQPEAWKALLRAMIMQLRGNQEKIVRAAQEQIIQELRRLGNNMLKRFGDDPKVRGKFDEFRNSIGLEGETPEIIKTKVLDVTKKFKKVVDAEVDKFREEFQKREEPVIESIKRFDEIATKFLEESRLSEFQGSVANRLIEKTGLTQRMRSLSRWLSGDNLAHISAGASRVLGISAGIIAGEETLAREAWEKRDKLRSELGMLIRDGIKVYDLLGGLLDISNRIGGNIVMEVTENGRRTKAA